ncbi:MAG: rhodanese-like domain-containing protein [Lachnospiraceae bacterium]|nr:rhodanese-like domain-containing protein [Lachnospiraceae bacterium]
MEHSKKMFIIIFSCIVLIGVFSAFILWRTFRPSQGLPYERITMEQAAEYMDYETGYLLVDVRTQEEYDEGHIPGAVCIPLEELQAEAQKLLPDKEQMIYVYCRSGRRSRDAAQKLCNMEYTNVTEIGGILDWNGETEKSK